MEQLKTDIDNYFKDMPYCITKFNPPECKITTKSMGSWLWIESVVKYTGEKWDYTTDSSEGDSEGSMINLNWIGKAESAPAEVRHPKELDKWSLINTKY